MQVPKKQFPAVGLLSLVLIGAAAGSIYYYQFVVPHVKTCGAPVHRFIFMKAIIEEQGGFSITGAAILNETGLPPPAASNQTYPAFNFTAVKFSNYTVNNPKAIEAFVGDTITVYILSVSTGPPQWAPSAPSQGLGHGFGVDQFKIPKEIRLIQWGTWGSTTFKVDREGLATFRCLHDCSPAHGLMTGSLVGSGCG